MFTGIIEEIGTIVSVKHTSREAKISISAKKIFSDLKLGDSIAVNGVCLTASDVSRERFTADVMNETFSRSSLSELTAGSHVNLERAMAANGRFGGHIVAGHVDGTGTIIDIKKDDNAIWYTIKADNNILKYIIEKGSVAIDGISLTIAKITSDSFSISIIPHTIQETILSEKSVGDIVNIENDLIGKYVERFLVKNDEKKGESNITENFLIKNGFI